MKNKSKVTVVMTGGGTAGHVVPHLALLPFIREKGWRPVYIGSSGIEKTMVEGAGVEFHTILAGKLRRYFSFQNFLDIFKVLIGFFQSLYFLIKVKPSVVFSKGGFVSVPVALAAWVLRIPVITHESDLTPGLANKIVKKFCHKILYTFPETNKYLPQSISLHVGSPVRKDILSGDKDKGYAVTGFSPDDSRPIVLVMGGSLGAQNLNNIVVENINEVMKQYRIIHLTGKGKKTNVSADGYVEFEFLSSELKDVFSIVDLVVARSGANSIFEFLALRKPMMLVPLEAGSRGDQLQNAKSFVESGYATLVREADLKEKGFLESVAELNNRKDEIYKAQSSSPSSDSIERILQVLESST